MNKFVIISDFNAKDTREEGISIFIRDDGKESVHFPVFMEFRIHRNFSFYLQQARAAIRSFAFPSVGKSKLRSFHPRFSI